MLHTYSIVPLTESCFDDVLNDVREQYERGVSSVPLFKMVLVPEGNPVWDKASEQCKIYSRYRKRLSAEGAQSGVLIQACMGHEYKLVPNPFQRIVRFTDGEEVDACCPEDPAFVSHFKDVVKKIALEHPDAIMLDDDVRLVMRPGRGCACPLHMAKFRQKTGSDMTREQLWEYVTTHRADDPLTMSFIEIQRDSLVNFVTELRESIDSVDPTIQGINCTSGDECDSVIYTNPIFAGKGNPTMVRVPNGTYAPENVRGFSDTMRRAVVCGSKLKNNGIDIVLAESDTIPFNRYGKNARYLHSHYTASVLDGLMGAKHWITRFSDNELRSGKAFRDILAQHKSYYEKLSTLAPQIKWVGVNSYFMEQKHHDFTKSEIWSYHENNWPRYVFERLGIPFYYSDKPTGAVFLEGDIVGDMSDEQIKSVFEKSVFLDSYAAADLIRRGYRDLIGVDISEATGVVVSGETFDGTRNSVCTKQKNLKIIKPVDEAVKALSYNYLKKEEQADIISPAVTMLERENGNISVVYCGIAKAEFNYIEGFAFLNETRKKQFVDLLSKADELPVYYDGDCEICLRAGYIEDGRLLASVYNLSYDPLDELSLYLKNKPESITLIDSHGEEIDLEFKDTGNDIYSLNVRVEPLYPVVVIIK